MTISKYEKFALDEYLTNYPSVSFNDILASMRSNQIDQNIWIMDAVENLPPWRVADMISDLRDRAISTFKSASLSDGIQ
jgi:hypothetical protein